MYTLYTGATLCDVSFYKDISSTKGSQFLFVAISEDDAFVIFVNENMRFS